VLVVTSTLPDRHGTHPPVILVHGAANSSGVWAVWQRELARRGWTSFAVDLRGHGRSGDIDLATVRMEDYAEDVRAVAAQLRQPPILMGWSMGGLVAMMVAASGLGTACVGLAPSVPTREIDSSLPLRAGVFSSEEYGITSLDPANQPTMPDLDQEERTIALASLASESRLARDERKRGIVIQTLPRPLLIVTGALDEQWPRQRYDELWLPVDHLRVEGASHWGLVLNRRALTGAIPAILHWIEEDACTLGGAAQAGSLRSSQSSFGEKGRPLAEETG